MHSFESLLSEGYREDDLKHLSYNTCTNKTGHHYIRILKSFKSRLRNLSAREEEFTKAPLINQFVLRFHLPKEPLSLKGKKEITKIKHVVIIVNGLNEFLPDRFDFYDFMASHFAEKGIASVLLSTPYHMHRVEVDLDSEIRNGRRRFIEPSNKLVEPLDLFIHFKISCLDIEYLAEKIKGINSARTIDDLNFYENHFSSDVKISLLGYSLGGLISLGSFIRNSKLVLDLQKEDKSKAKALYDNCVLYNTAPNLSKASTQLIGLEKKFWFELYQPETENLIRNDNEENFEFDYIFKDLYMGARSNQFIPTKRIIHENSKKLLLVMSGSDDIVDRKTWNDYLNFKDGERDKTIINEFIFAGVGHSPMNEPQGAESLPRVIDVMTDHILRSQTSHWQALEIMKSMKDILIHTDYFKRVLSGEEESYNQRSFDLKAMNILLEELKHKSIQDEFLEFYYLSKIYYPKFADLTKEIEREYKRQELEKKKS